jgi:hypothetical protein
LGGRPRSPRRTAFQEGQGPKGGVNGASVEPVQAPGASVDPDAAPVTVGRSSRPIGKRFTLVDGVARSEGGSGSFSRVAFSTASIERIGDLEPIIRDLGPNDVLWFGQSALGQGEVRPKRFFNKLIHGTAYDAEKHGGLEVSAEQHAALVEQRKVNSSTIPLTLPFWRYSSGPTVLAGDVDDAGNTLDIADFDTLACRIIPELSNIERLYCQSSSSNICDAATGETLKPFKPRFFVLVRRGEDVKRTGQALAFLLAKAGVKLDTTVWDGRHFLYEGPAEYGPGLVSNRGEPVVYEGGRFLDAEKITAAATGAGWDGKVKKAKDTLLALASPKPANAPTAGGWIDHAEVNLREPIPYTPENVERVESALKAIAATLAHNDGWLDICFALASLAHVDGWPAEEVLRIGSAWSDPCQRGSQGFADKFENSRPEGPHKGVGEQIFKRAAAAGWIDPAIQATNAVLPLAPVPSDQAGGNVVQFTGGGDLATAGVQNNVSEVSPDQTDVNEREAVEQLNKTYALVGRGGKQAVMCETYSANGQGITEFMTPKDFAVKHNNQYVTIKKGGDGSTKQLGSLWLTHRRRRTYHGVVFEPSTSAQEINGYFNLWRGFTITPRAGSWQKLKNHIFNVVADEILEHYDYIIRWIAWSLQNPGKVAEVSLVLRSDQEGTGKGTLLRAVARLFGRHAKQIGNPKHLVGNFNGHLEDCCFLFSDEAFWAGDHKAEKALMGMITEPTLAIEHKGFPVVQCDNHLKLAFSTNSDWAVPAGAYARRYAVFEIKQIIEQSKKKAYFGGIDDELNNGGYSAILHELLNMDLGDWHPRDNVPQTEALMLQKAASLSSVTEWLGELIAEGELPAIGKAPERFASSHALRESFREFVGGPQRNDSKLIAAEVRSFGAIQDTISGKTTRGWTFPPLEQVRAEWIKRYGPQKFSAQSDWGHAQVRLK